MDKKNHMAMFSSFLLITSSTNASCIAYCITFLLPLSFLTMRDVVFLNIPTHFFMLSWTISIIWFKFAHSPEQVTWWMAVTLEQSSPIQSLFKEFSRVRRLLYFTQANSPNKSFSAPYTFLRPPSHFGIILCIYWSIFKIFFAGRFSGLSLLPCCSP